MNDSMVPDAHSPAVLFHGIALILSLAKMSEQVLCSQLKTLPSDVV